MKSLFEAERPSDSPLIEKIWRTRSEQAVNFTSMAETCSELVIGRYAGKLSVTVRGPETKASLAVIPADGEWFGVVFKLGTFVPTLLPRNFMDRRDAYLPLASQQSFWLDSALWEIPTYENAETFVQRLVREKLLVCDPLIGVVLQGQPHELSTRAVQYRFLRATGLTQNTIQQINRAKTAMTLLWQGKSILDTVFEAGYFDQPHLTRSLKRFTGHTPRQLARTLGPGKLLTAEKSTDCP